MKKMILKLILSFPLFLYGQPILDLLHIEPSEQSQNCE